jgi:hypothetical protein
MTADRRRATWMGALLGALTAVLALALQARASDWQGSETEEFHQSYPISANGQIELHNINGPVEIKAWDRNEVKVDAIKRLEQGAAAEQKSPSLLRTSIYSSARAGGRGRSPLHQPGQYTVYPGAGVRKSGLLAMSSKAPVRLNAFKSPRLWNDWVT